MLLGHAYLEQMEIFVCGSIFSLLWFSPRLGYIVLSSMLSTTTLYCPGQPVLEWKTTPLVEGWLREKLSNHLLKIFLVAISIPCKPSGNQNVNKRTPVLREFSRAEEVAHLVLVQGEMLGQGPREEAGAGRELCLWGSEVFSGVEMRELFLERLRRVVLTGKGRKDKTSRRWALHVERHRGIK